MVAAVGAEGVLVSLENRKDEIYQKDILNFFLISWNQTVDGCKHQWRIISVLWILQICVPKAKTSLS
jgi:hypothetical protein